MKKLVQGIAEFRANGLLEYRKKFPNLALGQNPDALFIACSDSRVVPNVFASTNPGDLFVLRNIGNLIPPCSHEGQACTDESIAAVIEFSVQQLKVADIIVCGHSECAAIRAVTDGLEHVDEPALRAWLRHAQPLGTYFQKTNSRVSPESTQNELSQSNVLLQLEHIKTYPMVRDALAKNKLRLHAWWFDISTADVYCYEKDTHTFVLIDEKKAASFLEKLLKKEL